jgi:hypothetical protein
LKSNESRISPEIGKGCVHRNKLVPGTTVTALQRTALESPHIVAITGPSLNLDAGPCKYAAVTLLVSDWANKTPKAEKLEEASGSPEIELKAKMPSGLEVELPEAPIV